MKPAISCFVVAYNRDQLIETCLRGARFADQLIVIDKSSTDNTATIAQRLADQVITVPWSPTVEATRALALSHCVHDWILCLDDDEILSPDAVRYLHGRHFDQQADVHYIPLKHYILGRFDPRAYYWPEHHPRFFRRGAVEFRPVVHGGLHVRSEKTAWIPADSGICIHHLSNADVAGWIEKTNRYTASPTRVRVEDDHTDLAAFAHARIDHWISRTQEAGTDQYPASVALLRAIYDIVDRLKTYEEQHPNGALETTRAQLARAFDHLEATVRVEGANASKQGEGALPPSTPHQRQASGHPVIF